MLFQTRGGLAMKIPRTVAALQARGIDARLIDPVREHLREFDLVHVFASYNGNHRIVQMAKEFGKPVVLSTIMNPPFTRFEGLRARFLTAVIRKLTKWEVTTSYQQVRDALDGADHLVTLGRAERQMLIDSYCADASKISIVHNGIGTEFFSASPERFRRHFGIEDPFVLHAGLIGDVKNQLGLVRAMKGTGVKVVLAGHAGAASASYLAACLAEGGSQVMHLGEVTHGELMASAYAASRVVAIPSRHEGMPNSVLEGLASDRPVVLTNKHSIDFPLPSTVATEVDADDLGAIRDSVLRYWQTPPRAGEARAVVQHLSWDAVAERLIAIYRQLTGGSLPERTDHAIERRVDRFEAPASALARGPRSARKRTFATGSSSSGTAPRRTGAARCADRP
jgi:glycosyltransferase involved in cell wall biosynthesis